MAQKVISQTGPDGVNGPNGGVWLASSMGDNFINLGETSETVTTNYNLSIEDTQSAIANLPNRLGTQVFKDIIENASFDAEAAAAITNAYQETQENLQEAADDALEGAMQND